MKNHQDETRIKIESYKTKQQTVGSEGQRNSILKLEVICKEIFNENGEKVFQCKECSNTYTNINSLHKHFTHVHKEKRFKCSKCETMFPIKSILRKHFKTCSGITREITAMNKMKDVAYRAVLKENGEKEFKCTKCENSYKNQNSIRQHIHVVHGDKKFKCENCIKMFAFKSDLKSHAMKCKGIGTQNHTRINIFEMFEETYKGDGKKKFKCVKCENVYENEKAAGVHFHSQHREKKFKCDKCSKMLPIKSRLRKHLKTCNGVYKKERERNTTMNKMKDVSYKEILN